MADLQRKVGVDLSRRCWRSWCLLIGVTTTAVAMTGGCQTPQKLEVSQAGAPKFERFRAEYRFEQADQLLGRNFESDADGTSEDQGGSTSLRTVSAETSWSAARLIVECPHPGGDASLAMLELALGDRSGLRSFVRKDVRQLTISRSDVELLIGDLASQGYFDGTSGDFGSTQLSLEIDRGRIERPWINDARLLDLARQALLDGQPAN
jgi:hypothetical protein